MVNYYPTPIRNSWYNRRLQMSDNDKKFYLALGNQVAMLRKEQHITQVQMAQMLGISQQLVM